MHHSLAGGIKAGTGRCDLSVWLNTGTVRGSGCHFDSREEKHRCVHSTHRCSDLQLPLKDLLYCTNTKIYHKFLLSVTHQEHYFSKSRFKLSKKQHFQSMCAVDFCRLPGSILTSAGGLEINFLATLVTRLEDCQSDGDGPPLWSRVKCLDKILDGATIFT